MLDQVEVLYYCVFYLVMLMLVIMVDFVLVVFDGWQYEILVVQFCQWDCMCLCLVQVEVVEVYYVGLLCGGVDGIGVLGMLCSEIVCKCNYMVLCCLFCLCVLLIQMIKLVFMMSLLLVVQFLEFGVIDFDLLVIDEVSQVELVDVFGVIVCCCQIVVVGDDKQLLFILFFVCLGGVEDDLVEEEGVQVRDLESVLLLCVVKGLFQCMLQWYYCSCYELLIVVFNKIFYEGKLFIVLSLDCECSQFGLCFCYLLEGCFDCGNIYRNDVEVVVIVEVVVDYVWYSLQLMLGVGVMLVCQCQVISDVLELVCWQYFELEVFIGCYLYELFFVKNLENIQGDECDVILILIGYGCVKGDGKFYQGFGFLNVDGGYCCFNVLIICVCQCCEVFSSIIVDDICVDECICFGVIVLKVFLQYVEKGDLGVVQVIGCGVDLFFEVVVQEVLVVQGFQVDNQVGVVGFFIDLVVVDLDVVGCYLLGIECDGVVYYVVLLVCDCDWLCQEILENYGWNIYWIWSIDWFQCFEVELQCLFVVLVDVC